MDLAALRADVAARIRLEVGLDPPFWLLEARLRERATALGLDEVDYLVLAVGDGQKSSREREAVAALLRVGETRFFRHRAHVDALKARVLPERIRAATLAARPLEAWSAGCASGEEAWTLAMLLAEAAPPSGFRVLATDLSEEALVQAQAGVYGKARIADVPEPLRERYLQDFGDAQRVGDALRPQVRFSRLNLQTARYPGDFDLILCRNVLIYFDAPEREGVIARLHASLRDGGYLFLGYAETLRDQEERFEALRDDDGVVYRKRTHYRRSNSVPISVPVPAAVPAKSVHEDLTARVDGAADARLALTGEYHDGARLSAELKPYIQARRAVIDLDGAQFLGDEAARVLARATEAAPELELRATRPAVKRWLERHGLGRR